LSNLGWQIPDKCSHFKVADNSTAMIPVKMTQTLKKNRQSISVGFRERESSTPMWDTPECESKDLPIRTVCGRRLKGWSDDRIASEYAGRGLLPELRIRGVALTD
jgi:hypothetical protein